MSWSNKILGILRPKLFISHHHFVSKQPCHTHRVSLSNTVVEFSGTNCNFGFIFSSDLSMKQHIIKTCKAAYIRCISSIHQYLTEDATKTLVNSCILSRLDYCNSLLAGYPQTVIKPLQQQVQNSAAKLILKSRRAEHAKPLLKQLHWLPIEQRIKYNITCLCYQIITGTAPQYLALKLALKLTSSNSILTSNTFTAAQIWNSLSLSCSLSQLF